MSHTLHWFFEVRYKLISFTVSLAHVVQTNAKPKLIEQRSMKIKKGYNFVMADTMHGTLPHDQSGPE